MNYRYTILMTDPDGTVVLSLTQQLSADAAVRVLSSTLEKLDDGSQSAAEEEQESAVKRIEKKTKVKRAGSKWALREPCAECGSKGSRHKNGCSRAGKGTIEATSYSKKLKNDEEESTLKPDIKERIKDMRDEGMTTSDIAEMLAPELDMDVEQMKAEVGNISARKTIAYAEKTVPERKLLSTDQFEDIAAAMHDRDFNGAQYALSNKLSPREVGRAVLSATYDEYAAVAL